MAASNRQEEELGLYERLLAEAAQAQEKENPEREKHQRMQAYIRSHRGAVTNEGGYVTSQEIKKEQEMHLADLQALCGLVNGGVRSMGASYRLAWLRRKYPTEYAHLRDIEISSR